jgi:hypothetical protein
MNPSDKVTLKAFLTALRQIDSPLPPDIQTQLNEVAEQLKTSTNAIDKLRAIVQLDPQLKSAYLEARKPLQQDANERNKGKTDPMPPLPEESGTELINRSIAVFQATDSVAAAKSLPKQGLLQRVFSLFKKP